MYTLCYVTAFLDINRDDWSTFSRSFDDYLESFTPYINLFENNKDYKLVVYIDKKHYNKLLDLCIVDNIYVYPIDEEFLLQNSILWQRLPLETEIITSEKYKTEFKHRLQYPENNNPKYTLINHAKVDFVS